MRTTTVVIGAGHAGLAMSRHLADRSIDHVVLERGEVANSWKTQRWDSLRLLTPNWQSRLPGYGYQGDDPHGFRTMPETIAFIERYAALSSAPVRTHTRVTSVRRTDDGYLVSTTEGDWRARSVVVASGACAVPTIPAVAAALPPSITQLSPLEYRNPGQLEPGGVLVVGASASGTQIAEEIHRSGRPVTLSVGEHVRVPRTYRGRDIKWWMDTVGVLDEFYTGVDSIERVRGVPSLQLIGSDDRRNIDLNALTAQGIRLVGRLAGVANGKAQFSGSLRNLCEMADLKMNRLLDRIDQWAADHLGDRDLDPPSRFDPTRVEDSPPLMLDLAGGGIRTIVWATGFRPDYSWLDVPVFDRKGRLQHDGGVVSSPGLYLMGLPFLRRRKSSLIDGAGDDARDLSAHLAAWLDGRALGPTDEYTIAPLRGAA
ncbi:MAG: NAD(P)-binding domain-containing protein [Actinomycetota bacterium]|nr:NAD(P)-binding domain-containing protein [Actinomycetota bacterium]MDH4348842.1 NAD(P)-binding domain-containing protein [Gemmatimonadota bacterium]